MRHGGYKDTGQVPNIKLDMSQSPPTYSEQVNKPRGPSIPKFFVPYHRSLYKWCDNSANPLQHNQCRWRRRRGRILASNMCLSLNNFCCCFSLSTGAKIVSVISSLCSATSVVLYGTPAILQFSTLPPGRLVFYGCAALAGLLQTVFGCLLIHGSFRKKPRYLWPWILLSWLECVSLMVLSVAGTVLLGYNRKLEDNAEISSVIAVYFLISIILFYFVSVVNSRRQQMANDDYKYLSKRLVKYGNNYYI